MVQIKSKVVWVMGGVTLVMLAYLIGTQSANVLKEWNLSRNANEYRTQAADQTAAILRKMGTIKVGDTLGNFPLEDIDGKLHLLSELVTDKTLITYLKLDCDACLEELERLRSIAKGPDDYEHVILIASANPLHMQRIRQDYGLGCEILYDNERQFGAALKIQSFPFNLVVDRDRVIQTIHANTLLPDDYEQLFEATGDAREVGVPHSSAVGSVGKGENVETTGVSTYDSRQMCASAGHVLRHGEPVEG